MSVIRRREFITLLGGAAVWPVAGRAQQPGRVRRIGVLSGLADDSEGRFRVTTFQEGLRELGWTEGHNVRIELRWAAGDVDRMRTYAAELVATKPDAILAHHGGPGAAAACDELHTNCFCECRRSGRKRHR
jgi:putative ABC transport system substrate-binding protein